jgi:hypothetical protein
VRARADFSRDFAGTPDREARRRSLGQPLRDPQRSERVTPLARR